MNAVRVVLLASFLVVASFASHAQPATAKHYMVAAAHPLAVEAGLRMLARGGSAVDAMIAAQLVLGVAEPAATGLGGGGFLLYYDARARKLRAYDGREVAPAGATAALFLKPEGKPMAFDEARVGGRAVGVPGMARLLEVAYARHGRLPWKALFGPAIEIAEKGFVLLPRVFRLLGENPRLADEPGPRALFFGEDGRPKPPGSIIRNPELARTLRAIAAGGADAFYHGGIARDVVAAVTGHRNAGTLSLDDLAQYRVREVDPVCGNYRAWKLCGMPPSSSGGVAIVQVMGMLERFDMASLRPGSAAAVHAVSEAERLAFADRARYLADDRFVDVPVKGLVDRGYIAERSQLIRPDRSMGVAVAGKPEGIKLAFAPDPVDDVVGTSHLCIVDREGNVVSMTTTIEANFGSHVMARGFLLNNELTDFNFLPVGADGPVANSVAPGKRPRSSMSPTLVFNGADGSFELAIGSAGGSYIIGHVAKTLVAALDWKMDMQQAIDAANFDSRNGPTEIEKGTELEAIAPTLKAMGHDVRIIGMPSGLHGIRRVRGGLQGGADPRRDGVARGN